MMYWVGTHAGQIYVVFILAVLIALFVYAALQSKGILRWRQVHADKMIFKTAERCRRDFR